MDRAVVFVLVLFRVDLDAERLHVSKHRGADMGRIFAHARREHDGVQPAQRRHIGAHVLFAGIREHVERKLRAVIALLRRGRQIAVIGGDARNAEHAALFVEIDERFVDIHALFVAQEFHRRRVDVAAARSHGHPRERRETHGRIDAFPALDGRNGRTVSEVAGDDLQIFGILSEIVRRRLRDVLVRRAVRAVLLTW